jgi:hypothetical protein
MSWNSWFASSAISFAVTLPLMDFLSAPARAEAPYESAWIRQWGSPGHEGSIGVSTDRLGNVFVSGFMNQPEDAPKYEAFLRKYDSSGNLNWTKITSSQFGHFGAEVSADGLGNAYLVGTAYADRRGGDAFLHKYDSLGNLSWDRTIQASSTEYGSSVSSDQLGNVFIAGYTSGSLHGLNAGGNDGFVTKFDSAGNLHWTRQFGSTAADSVSAAAADGYGNVFVAGSTWGAVGDTNLGQLDAFIGKYDAEGNLLWLKNYGGALYEQCFGATADSLGNLYITGFSVGLPGNPQKAGYDAYVSKLDPNGNELWAKQFGFGTQDAGSSVVVDKQGYVYVTGVASPDYTTTTAREDDVFINKFDAQGNMLWSQRFGTTAGDSGSQLAIDELGSLYVAGMTWGSLAATNTGQGDAYVAKFSPPVPEPSALLLASLCAGGLMALQGSRKKE